jgi:hypothetical protein
VRQCALQRVVLRGEISALQSLWQDNGPGCRLE